MRQRLQLKISTKIVLGFTIVIILSIIVGCISFYSMGIINQGMVSMYEYNLLPIKYLGEVNRELLTIRGDVFRYMNTENPSESDEIEKSIVASFGTLKESLQKFKETDFTLADKKEAKKFEEYITHYETEINNAISERRTGDPGLVTIILDNSGINRERAVIILNNLIRMYTETAEKEEANSNQTYRNSSVQILVLLIASAIISIIITILVSRSIRIPIAKSLKLAKSMADGDLTSRIDHSSGDEIGELIQALNSTAGSLQNVVKEVLNSSAAVSSASQQLSATMEEANSSMQEIANGIGHIAESNESNTAAIEQISASINDISDKALATAESSKLAAETGEEVKSSAEKGGELVVRVSDSIDSVRTASGEVSNIMLELEKSAREINQAVELITNISEQTNLLSLNAAIEAARAGEQGRGFAVVADEVRALAEQSKEATRRIEQMVKEIQKNCEAAREKTFDSDRLIRNSYEAASESSSHIMNIIEKINKIVDQINEIAETAVQQSLMTKEISTSVESMAENVETQASSSEQISATTQQQASSIEEIGATTEELASMAANLNNIVSKFKA